MDKQALEPMQIVLDLVIQWTDKLTGQYGTGSVVCSNGSELSPESDKPLMFMFFVKNHRGKGVGGGVPVHLEGETNDGLDGKPCRWVFNKIAPGVWKPSQSLMMPELHAYFTLVGVPEPAPWEPGD
jgi:hypothetical protein